MWHLHSRIAADNGTTVLVLEGRLSHITAADFERAAKAVIRGGAPELVIDLSAVDYLSSAGLKVIADLAAELTADGRALTVRSPSPAARLSLELAGMSAMFRV